MPIDTPHPQYAAEAQRWQRNRDLAAGQDAVKASASVYLPRPEGMDQADYLAYVDRPLLHGAYARTLEGHVGAIQQKPPLVAAPTHIEAHLKDVSLQNEPLEVFAGRVLREVLTTGRFAILIDMAGAEAVEPLRPYWVGYAAERVISWRTARRGGDETLVRVVIRETVEQAAAEDPHVLQYETQYRELFLNPAGEYQVRIWTKLPGSHLVEPTRTVWVPGEPVTPVRRGEPLRFLPFTFINAANLSPDVNRPPLTDLADTVLSHFKNAADREHALFYVSAPVPWVSGASTGGRPLRIGSSVAWLLEKDAKAGFLEFGGQGVGAQTANMAEKVRLMAVLGARMLEDQGGSRVEAWRTIELRHAGEAATLRGLAQVVERGLSMALQVHGWWCGVQRKPSDVEASVELFKDFARAKMDAAHITALMGAYQGGGMSFSTLFYNLQQGELVAPMRTEEEELAQIDTEERKRLELTKEELEAQRD